MRNTTATPPTTPPTMAPILEEELFFPVADASDAKVGRIMGAEDDAAVRAGIPGDMEKVTEEVEAVDVTVDEGDGGGVEEEVFDFLVTVEEEEEEEEDWSKTGFCRSADPLTTNSPRFCLQHVAPMVPFPQQKLPSLHGVTVKVLAVRSISLPARYCPFEPTPRQRLA